jgi:DNA-binding PadR family transcriptional regulator
MSSSYLLWPVRLATGTLYAALDRLTAEGYVELMREASSTRSLRTRAIREISST